MKNERASIFTVICLLVSLSLVTACHSTRRISEDTHAEQHFTSSADSTFNAAATAERTTESRSDFSNVRADERGRVEIERDSAGRPVVIIWNHNWRLQGNNAIQTETGKLSAEVNASHHSEASGMVDSDTSKKEETTVAVDPALPVKCAVGVLFGIVLLYLSLNFSWPWIKKLRRRQ